MVKDQHFVTPDGVTIALTVAGPEDGDPVLFFHGGGQTRHAWGRTVEMLGSLGWRAIAADLRGHGDSSRASKYDPADFASDVRALSMAQEKRPAIVGASLGGMASLLANVQFGNDGNCVADEVSRALVLVDIAPRTNAVGVKRIIEFMAAHPDGFSSLDDAAMAVAAYQPQRSQRSDSSGLRKNLRLGMDGRWYWHWDPALLTHFHGSRERENNEEMLYRAAENITQPMMLLRGGMSDVVDDVVVGEFSARIPDAIVRSVGGAGHMVAGDRNDIFNTAIIDFLDKVANT